MAQAKETNKKPSGRKKPSARRSSYPRRKQRAVPRLRYFTIALVFSAAMVAIAYYPILRPAFRRFTNCNGHFIYGACIPKGYSIYGIDVSHHQGHINWKRVKKGTPQEPPITFAYMKATEGSSHSDTRFEENWSAAKTHGFIRGAYHYFSTKSPGEVQAKMFISKVKLEPGDLPPMVDVEDEPADKEKFRQELKKFIDIVEAHYKVKPIIYTYSKFKKRHIEHEDFNGYHIWIARYNAKDPGIENDGWIIWQCNSKGRIPGIGNDVDINVFNGGNRELKELLIK